jgi:integrase
MDRSKDKLTPRLVAGHQAGWLGDGAGLWLRADANRKRWIFRRTMHGRTVEMGLGGADTVTLAQARKKRDQILAQLADGLDPKNEKRKTADKQRARRKFREAAEAVIAARGVGWRVAVDGRNSSLADWTKSLVVDCKPLAGRFVDEVDVDDVRRCVQPHWDDGKHATARRLLSRIEAVLEYSLAHGWRTADNPAAWRRFQYLAPSQPKNGDKQHHAALPWQDMPHFVARLRKINTMAALALEFAILTATRSSEARGARWSEVDLDGGTWVIPGSRMKASEAHAVPLSRQALQLLDAMDSLRAGKLVFPGVSDEDLMHNTRLWQLVKRLEPDATTHGFRSSFRDWCGEHGVERELAEMCLAHKIGNTAEQAYSRSKLIERRRPIMQQWADFLDGEAAAEKVVPIKQGRRR